MAFSKSISLLGLPKPYISNQHGALITLIFVNFIAVIHSSQFHVMQIFALLSSLSAFHTTEIFLLPLNQKRQLKTAFLFYFCLSAIGSLFVFTNQSQLPVLLAGLLFLSTIFFIVKNNPKAKTTFHLVSFALLIWISLFSLITPSIKTILNLFIQLFIYFTFTVAFIHWRMGKISFEKLKILAVIELGICFLLYSWKGIPALIIILLSKNLIIYTTKGYWQKAPLKIFGYEETISLTLYIILMTFL